MHAWSHAPQAYLHPSRRRASGVPYYVGSRPAPVHGWRQPRTEMLDFIINPLVDFCVEVIGAIGYAGIFLLMLLESACIPIPSEATMLFAGFKVDDGDLTLIGIVTAGVLGNLVGSWAAYAAGYYGRVEMLEKNRLVHINPKHMAVADDWFRRYGSAAVFFSRMLPIIRTFISLPAGVARMPFWRFTWLTVAGCIPWVLMLAVIGVQVGERWEQWRDNLHYLDYAVLAGLLGLVAYAVIRRLRGGPPSERAGRVAAGDAEQQSAAP